MRSRSHGKCKVCKSEYIKRSITHKTCSVECSLIYIESEKKKAYRKEHIKRTVDLYTRSDWIRMAQIEVNRYVRIRDQLAGHRCICCNEPLDFDGSQVDAGHWRSTGSAPHLRFDTFGNISAQRKHCNRWRAGRAMDQEPIIRERWGDDVADAILADQQSRKWSIAELIEIRGGFRQWANELKRQAKKYPTEQ